MTCSCQISRSTLEESQEAYLLACYDLWWVSCVVSAIANCTHSSHWKRSHRCLFCSSGARQEARKAVAIGKWHQNFWMKHFQWKPYNKNEVCRRLRGNRQTDRRTDRQNDYRNPMAHAPRVNYGLPAINCNDVWQHRRKTHWRVSCW